MKTFIYKRINLHKFENTGRPEDEIEIFRVKNNVPVRLVQIVRGYRNANQAVVDYLTANKHIKSPPKGDSKACYYNSIDLETYADARIIEI